MRFNAADTLLLFSLKNFPRAEVGLSKVSGEEIHLAINPGGASGLGIWTSKDLAAAVGVPVDVLNKRIFFWINKGILAESVLESSDHTFTLLEAFAGSGKAGVSGGNYEELIMGDEDGDKSVAAVQAQLRKEMIVYENLSIMGMLTNFGSMALDKSHNTLKMFCIGDPTYDKSLQQLQSFLGGLVVDEKLEPRDGMYFLKT